MKKTFYYLLIAVLGNAFGTALMAETNLGMTAWGSSAINITNYFSISLGTSFIIISSICYVLAVLIKRKINWYNAIQSHLFLLTFGIVTDLFLYILPSLDQLHNIIRYLLNMIGLLILLFSIALHLEIQVAVHPMDVFLHAVQVKVKNVAYGTYIVYVIAFSIAIAFGLLYGEIQGVGFGTIITVLFGGIIMGFYKKYLLQHI